ncbi:MAG: MFS transporter [Smithella sp.]
MMLSRVKILFYFIELINCYAAVFYSNFLFFYLKNTFGFGEVANLATAALGGFVYIIASWQGGRLAQRYGSLKLLSIGACIVILSLILGVMLSTPAEQISVYCFWTVGICLMWPALEILISERAGKALPKMIGIYNVTWAVGGFISYFSAGMLIEKFGMASLFWIPLGITLIELSLMPLAAGWLSQETAFESDGQLLTPESRHAETGQFIRMAWIANPFSYVAINTVIPLIPSIAEKLSLSTGMAGIVCSVWMFARLMAFVTFWQWTDWHYRFQWLAGSFFMMIVSFFGILMAQSVGFLLVAQVGFGLSIGLIYYSSLYYSMNVTENQGANAGVHEAMIGAGQFIGPAVGAAALYLVPAATGIGAWSVGGLLCIGLSGLFLVRHHGEKS